MDRRGDRRVTQKQGGALVPLAASSSALAESPRLSPPRSPFLTQLARQYESRDEALVRRDETRAAAEESYTRPRASDTPRHIVWA